MNNTREQILVDLTKAAHGPLGRRSLAMTLRKAHALLLALREDGITWQQIADLLSETGHHANSETIRRTFTRIKSASGRPQQSAPASPAHDAGQAIKDNAASSPARIAAQTSIAERATGPPGPDFSVPSTSTQNGPGLEAGAWMLDALQKLKEIDP